MSIGYIRGTIFDFGIFGLMFENTQWLGLLMLGLLNFAVFYALFRYAIVKFDIKPPGREDDIADNSLLNNKEYDKVAAMALQGLGGANNVVN